MNSDMHYATFLHLIREKRIISGKTQKEIADSLKKPQSFVSKYESGQRRLDIIEFIEVCKCLDVNPTIFIHEIERAINES